MQQSHKDHLVWTVSVWQPVSSGVVHPWCARDLALVRCGFLFLECSSVHTRTAFQPWPHSEGTACLAICHNFMTKSYTQHPVTTTLKMLLQIYWIPCTPCRKPLPWRLAPLIVLERFLQHELCTPVASLLGCQDFKDAHVSVQVWLLTMHVRVQSKQGDKGTGCRSLIGDCLVAQICGRVQAHSCYRQSQNLKMEMVWNHEDSSWSWVPFNTLGGDQEHLGENFLDWRICKFSLEFILMPQ